MQIAYNGTVIAQTAEGKLVEVFPLIAPFTGNVQERDIEVQLNRGDKTARVAFDSSAADAKALFSGSEGGPAFNFGLVAYVDAGKINLPLGSATLGLGVLPAELAKEVSNAPLPS